MSSNARGQSLIETAIFLCLFVPLIGGFVEFTRAMQIRQKLLLAAWQGAELYSSGCLAKPVVERRLMNFLVNGRPKLDPQGVRIHMGRLTTPVGLTFQLDEIKVSYTPRRPWHRLLGLPRTLEETCTIKHAPHYWDPVHQYLPGTPAVVGPAYPW